MKQTLLCIKLAFLFLVLGGQLLAEPVRLVMVGPPGAGKGTQAKRLARHYGIAHISTGAMLRDHISRATELGMKAKSFVDSGELVPNEIIVGMLKETLKAQSGGFILDGFPRTLEQAEVLDEITGGLHKELSAVVHISVPDDVVVQRLLQRGRKDDKEDVIRRRLEIFSEDTAPIIDHYGKRSLVVSIDGVGSIEDVQNRIRKGLEAHNMVSAGGGGG